MAGEMWVLDIVWHVLLLAPNAVVSFWRSWSMEFLVLVSLLLHICLAIFARVEMARGWPPRAQIHGLAVVRGCELCRDDRPGQPLSQ